MLDEKKNARRALLQAQKEKGSKCDYPGAWRVYSAERVVSEEEAKKLCSGCPLLGVECRRYVRSGEPTWGVWDGKFIDTYNFAEELEGSEG